MKKTRHKSSNIAGFHFSEVPRKAKFVETESRVGAAGGEHEDFLVHGDRVSGWDDGDIFEMHH